MANVIKISDLKDGVSPYLSEEEQTVIDELFSQMDIADGLRDGFIRDGNRAKQIFERASVRLPYQLGNWEAVKTILLSKLPGKTPGCGDVFVQGVKDFRGKYATQRRKFHPFRPIDAFGESMVSWLDYYKKNGLQKTIAELEKWPPKERQQVIMGLMRSDYAIRIHLQSDRFKALRLILGRLICSRDDSGYSPDHTLKTYTDQQITERARRDS